MTVVAATAAPGRPEKRALFPDQVEAVTRVARHLRRPGTRGLFVAATGTGKTLVSIRLADELQARLVLFVVPTLDLAAQTALAWHRDGHTEHMVIVSSMDAAGRDALVAARVMSSTDPLTLAALMSVVGEGENQIPALTLICTYDSLDKIQETRKTQYAVPPFDLAIMDEAHRIAGRPDKKWAAVHDNQRIQTDRRLYMTATPRIFAAPDLAESADTTHPRRHTPTTPGPAADLFANSMDNEQVYGKKIWEYPLAQAIEDGRAPDYRIVVPTLTDDDLRRRINLPAPDLDGPGDAHRADPSPASRQIPFRLPHVVPQLAQREVFIGFGLPLFSAQMVVRVAESAGRIVVRTAGHGFGPLVDADSAGERFGQADAVAVFFHQYDGDAERVGAVQLDRGEAVVHRGLDGRYQLAAGLRRGGRPPFGCDRRPALGAAGQELLGVGELVQHVPVAGGEHHVQARCRADDRELAGGGDVVRLPGEDDLVRAGRRGDVRELRDPGERVLADLERAAPDQPDQLAAYQRHHQRARHDPLAQRGGVRLLRDADQAVPHPCFHGSPLPSGDPITAPCHGG